MPLIRRLLRSPWFWLVFVIAQVAHPRTPLSYTLWTSFGTQHDVIDVDSVHGERLPSGDLSLSCEVDRTLVWFGERQERLARELVIPRTDLLQTQHRYRLEEAFKTPWTHREAPTLDGELPVLMHGITAPTEFEALSFGVRGLSWTSGWRDEGDWLVGHNMLLPIEQNGLRPGARAWRLLLTPFALLADLLALPVILGQLILMMFIMGSLGGH